MQGMNNGWTAFTTVIVAAIVAVVLTVIILVVYEAEDSEPPSQPATIASFELQRVLESIRTDEEIHQGRCYRLMGSYLDRDTREAGEAFEAIAEEGCWPTP